MFITEAYAQAQGGAGDAFVSFLPFLAILAIMYFLLIRPQQKKAKQHREMVAALRRGDAVVTAGGIVGRVVRVRDGDDRINVEIAKGVEAEIVRSTITAVVSKSDPLPDNS